MIRCSCEYLRYRVLSIAAAASTNGSQYNMVHLPSSNHPTTSIPTMSTISTPITQLFGIKHPILLAGSVSSPIVPQFPNLADQFRMNVAAGPELAAAVTNAGGLGVIGGVGYTPKILRSQVRNYMFFASRCSTEFTRCREGNSNFYF